MTWVRIDDGFTDHPKVVQAGPIAGWLYVCGLTYASRYLTDGFLSYGTVRRLCAEIKRPEVVAQTLVQCGLWEAADGGYQIHDYLTYNPSADKVRAERDATARRVAAHRDRLKARVASLETAFDPSESHQSNGVTSDASNEPVTAPPARPGPGPAPAHVPVRSATSRVNSTGGLSPAVKTRVAHAATPPEQKGRSGTGKSSRVPNLAPLADAFTAIGLAFPDPIGPEITAAGTLLQHYPPSDIAECWQDYLQSDRYDDYDRRKLSFAYLTRENRMGNWQRWRDEGKPRQEKPHATNRIHAAGGDPQPDLDELDRDWDQLKRERFPSAART